MNGTNPGAIGLAALAFAIACALGFVGCASANPTGTGARSAGSEARIARESGAPRPAQRRFRDCVNCPWMIEVPPGAFLRRPVSIDAAGTPRERAEAPASIEIARAFALGAYEVTLGEYRRFVAGSGHRGAGGCARWNARTNALEQAPAADWSNAGLAETVRDDHPVACIRWSDAAAYAAWLARETGKPYRLPSGLEWEYAARAGSDAAYPWGESVASICAHANVYDAAASVGPPGIVRAPCSDGEAQAASVGRFAANAFGLHDLLGNVWEWTSDCYARDYDDLPRTAAAGAARGEAARGEAAKANATRQDCARRGNRGGSWQTTPARARPDFPSRSVPTTVSAIFGFRVARDLP